MSAATDGARCWVGWRGIGGGSFCPANLALIDMKLPAVVQPEEGKHESNAGWRRGGEADMILPLIWTNDGLYVLSWMESKGEDGQKC